MGDGHVLALPAVTADAEVVALTDQQLRKLRVVGRVTYRTITRLERGMHHITRLE